MDAVGVGVDSEAEEVESGFRLEINGWAVKRGRGGDFASQKRSK